MNTIEGDRMSRIANSKKKRRTPLGRLGPELLLATENSNCFV
jgi:hypothetical protein